MSLLSNHFFIIFIINNIKVYKVKNRDTKNMFYNSYNLKK